MTTFWISFVVATFIGSELLRPRPRPPEPGDWFEPGERVKMGLFSSMVVPQPERYAGERLDLSNPYRGPRAD